MRTPGSASQDSSPHPGDESPAVLVRFHGGVFDRPAPEYELYSLGGVSTVRGYREDTWLGRGLLNAQS